MLVTSFISQNGFLPEIGIHPELPKTSALNRQLNHIIHALPQLTADRVLRKEIYQLEQQFNRHVVSDLQTPSQQLSAVMILSMIAQGFLFEEPQDPVGVLPEVIARNLFVLCQPFERLPTFTYADYILYNWRLQEPNIRPELQAIEPLFTFTNSVDEKWFIKIHVATEYTCASTLHAAWQICQLTQLRVSPDIKLTQALIPLLLDISHSLECATEIIQQMQENCEPNYFWRTLRPFLNGWEKIVSYNSAGQTQVGVELSGVDSPIANYRGPSGAQSCIIPALDAALGIKHDNDHFHNHLLALRQYAPLAHRHFIERLSENKLQLAIETLASSELNFAWENSIEKLKLFRTAHIKLVEQYIYKPAQKAGISTQEHILGTGGTPVVDYLNARIKSTEKTVQSIF